ncbi:MAG: tRNA (adenosine(37)-N6)-threonylcarbamoyltransferase complex ATPase subunit type 1 TsaE [Sulfobacillus sp.]
MRVALAAEEQTVRLGWVLGQATMSGSVIGLVGEVGSGKTTLARAVLAAWQVVGTVASPTYTLIHTYPQEIYHIDLYRLDASQAADLGLDELWTATARAVVEWADRAPGLLPADSLTVQLQTANQGRTAELAAAGPNARRALHLVEQAWKRS